MKLFFTALSVLAAATVGFAASERATQRELRRINLTKPPINTTCPLDNYVLFPTQNFFKQNEGGFIKLIIQNPLDVPIAGPIVATLTAPNGPNSRVAPNTPEITSYRLQGGLFFYKPGETVPGIDNKYARSAKSSRGVPPPVITPGNTPPVANRTVTWTLDSIPARAKLNLVALVRIGPGTPKTTRLQATVTYPRPAGGPNCVTLSYPQLSPITTVNGFSFQVYITPVNSITTSYQGKTITYQQYASVYKNCRPVLAPWINNTGIDGCAAACNANPECQSFVLRPRSTSINLSNFTDQSCLLYSGNPGSSDTMNYENAAGNATRFGNTIFLRNKSPTRYIAGASGTTCASNP